MFNRFSCKVRINESIKYIALCTKVCQMFLKAVVFSVSKALQVILSNSVILRALKDIPEKNTQIGF